MRKYLSQNVRLRKAEQGVTLKLPRDRKCCGATQTRNVFSVPNIINHFVYRKEASAALRHQNEIGARCSVFGVFGLRGRLLNLRRLNIGACSSTSVNKSVRVLSGFSRVPNIYLLQQKIRFGRFRIISKMILRIFKFTIHWKFWCYHICASDLVRVVHFWETFSFGRQRSYRVSDDLLLRRNGCICLRFVPVAFWSGRSHDVSPLTLAAHYFSLLFFVTRHELLLVVRPKTPIALNIRWHVCLLLWFSALPRNSPIPSLSSPPPKLHDHERSHLEMTFAELAGRTSPLRLLRNAGRRNRTSDHSHRFFRWHICQYIRSLHARLATIFSLVV